MKFASLVAFASLVCSALGQSIEIGYPPQGSQIKPGGSFIVQVVRPVRRTLLSTIVLTGLHAKRFSQDTLTGSNEVAIVISLLDCPRNQCPNPADVLGNTLYSGPYDPQFPKTPTLLNAPEQNFTVTTPIDFTSNTTAQLSVVHLAIVGVSHFASCAEFRGAEVLGSERRVTFHCSKSRT
jgi:hypothetical protein